MTTQTVSNQIWTIPNAISAIRLFVALPLALYLLLQGTYGWSLVVLTILGATDWLDGYLARKLNQMSRLGKRMDVIADRISIVAIAVCMLIAGLIPWVLAVILVGMDALVIAVTWVLFRGEPAIPVTFVGKARTATLLFALPLRILGAAINVSWVYQAGLIFIVLGAALHIIAGITYIVAMIRLARDNSRMSAQQASKAAG